MVLTPTQAPPGEAEAAAAGRRDITGALFDAGLWFEAHPGSRLPASPVVNIRVAGANHDEKTADLRAIAASWAAPVMRFADGTLYAELVFGPLTFEAHVPPADKTVSAYKARMAAIKAEAA
jgi:hypothetical protein